MEKKYANHLYKIVNPCVCKYYLVIAVYWKGQQLPTIYAIVLLLYVNVIKKIR